MGLHRRQHERDRPPPHPHGGGLRGPPLLTEHSRPIRWALIAAGFAAVAVGTIGIVVPGLPTTGFFVLAAGCFARSSPRFEQWILELPGIGPMVRDYRAGKGMPRRAKVAAIASITVAVGLSAGLVLEHPIARATVVAAGAIGVWYVGWRIPTRRG